MVFWVIPGDAQKLHLGYALRMWLGGPYRTSGNRTQSILGQSHVIYSQTEPKIGDNNKFYKRNFFTVLMLNGQQIVTLTLFGKINLGHFEIMSLRMTRHNSRLKKE